MNRSGLNATCMLAAALLLLACGSNDPVPELYLVPGTALMHVHMEPGVNTHLTSFAGDQFQGFILADSLLNRGPLGVSVVGVDITVLEPQLLLLSNSVSTEYATALAARVLDLDPREEENRVDLISEQGYARASVTQRDGWTAVYIGPAPHITLNQWLDLDRNNSLAADTALASVIPLHRQISVLLPGNLFGFLSFLPLERQIPWWTDYKDVAAVIKPAALSFSLSWPDPDAEEPISAGLILARRGGGITSLDISISDTAVDPDSCFRLLLQLMEDSQ